MIFVVLGFGLFLFVVLAMNLRSGKGTGHIPFEPPEGMDEYLHSFFEKKRRDESTNSTYKVQARVVECAGIHGLRKQVYLAAETNVGMYKGNGCAIERDGKDLVVDIVFRTMENAHHFMTSLLNLCEWNRAKYEDVVVEVFEGAVMVDVKGNVRVITRMDFKPEDTDSPDGSASQSQTAQTFLSATDLLTRFQSVERPSLFRSGKAHACHIIDKKLLPPEKKGVRDENNLLAMTGTMHSMFDGTSAEEEIPTFRISVEKETGESNEGRHEVVLKIEALNEEVAHDVQCFLRDGFRREAGRFFYLSVFVKDVELFKYNISFKHDLTSKRWKKYGHD